MSGGRENENSVEEKEEEEEGDGGCADDDKGVAIWTEASEGER